MLPGSTPERASREAAKGKQSGRTQEIQRLIAQPPGRVRPGRPRRGADHGRLRRTAGRRRDADGLHLRRLRRPARRLYPPRAGRDDPHNPLTDSVAAVSVGIIDGVPMLDLPYAEDSRAEVDMNVVMTGAGRFVEVQGTAEGMAFSRSELDEPARAGRGGHQGADGPAGGRAGRAPAGAVSGDGPLRLVLASANPDKVKEITAILGRAPRGAAARARPVRPTWSRTARRCSTTPG